MPPPRKKIMTFIYYNKIIKHIKSIKSTFLIIKNNNNKIALLSKRCRCLSILYYNLHVCLRSPIVNSFHDSTHLSGSHTNSCSCFFFFSHIIGFFTLEDFDFQALILNIFYRVVLLSLK